jgi:hypothetical protein
MLLVLIGVCIRDFDKWRKRAWSRVHLQASGATRNNVYLAGEIGKLIWMEGHVDGLCLKAEEVCLL